MLLLAKGTIDDMTAPTSPTATVPSEGPSPGALDQASSVPKQKGAVHRLVFMILAALGVALTLDAALLLLPENDYQRWQLLDGTLYEQLRWMYERIHFDLKPIDVAILGSSRSQLGLSAAAIERDLAQHGRPASVVNFSIVGAGRNLQWAILDELFKAKSPEVIVLMVDDQPYPFGHAAFRYVAPTEAVVFPPTPLMHNYLYDLAYLPARSAKLVGANLFPDLFGLSKQFDPDRYAHTRIDYTTSFISGGKLIDMDRRTPRATLLAEPREPVPRTLVARGLARLNGGEDHLYISKIANEAKSHGAQLIFVFLPMFNGPQTITDLPFLQRYGTVVDNGDLAQQDGLYENWAHMNHAGAMTASTRLAKAIDGLLADGPSRLGDESSSSTPRH